LSFLTPQPLHRSEPRRLVLGEEGVDDFVEGFAAHHFVDLVERQADAVVGDAALREVVGADALRTVAAADLALAVGGAGSLARPPLHVVNARAQHFERLRLVLVLRFLVLLDHDEP